MSAEKKTGARTDEPFLSRWARVKQTGGELRPTAGGSLAEESASSGVPNSSIGAPSQPEMPEEARPEPTLPDSDAPPVLPSLDSMTPQSDFSPFMAKDVDPQLRNLAMKKLFTDPHYNVMDRLDIYIDDYSTHAPLPMAVIRQMTISQRPICAVWLVAQVEPLVASPFLILHRLPRCARSR